jgi:hypothetical protein
MKRVAAILGVALGLTAGAMASPLPLQGRDINGNAVGATDAAAVFEYDPNLNMTWLRDWNYAKTSGYSTTNAGGTGENAIYSSGQMGWNAAKTWASNLTVGGFSGWRLPEVTDTGRPGCNDYTLGTDCGYNVYGYGGSMPGVVINPGAATLSPMAYLWYVELGNKAFLDIYGNPQPGFGLENAGLFINMQSSAYWSGTEFNQDDLQRPEYVENNSWYFATNFGLQQRVTKSSPMFAVALRAGDVGASVPEPSTIALLFLSLGAMAWAARRKQA